MQWVWLKAASCTGCAASCRRYVERGEVLAAIAFDVPTSIDGSRPSISRALRFVRQVLKAGGESNDGIGIGTEFRFNSSRVAAQGLSFENQLVCLSVIAA